MKKFMILILLIIIIVIGKIYIDNKTINYEEIVNASLSSYYISGSKTDLKPITDLLEKINYDDKLKAEIQKYSFTIIDSWYSYLDGKYICTKSNLNSCLTQVEEYKILDTKLKDLYKYKCKDGFTIILPSSYTNLVNTGEEKITALNKIIKSPSAKDPKNSEEIRNEKCAKATVCESCRDGLCVCTYINEFKGSEKLTCKDKNYNPEKE